MACEQCSGSHSSYPYNSPCNCSKGSSKGSTSDATCVYYTGAPLNCIGVGTNINIEEVLLEVDSKLCESSVAPDWSSFNYHCIDDNLTITTPGQFVGEMTSQFCTLKTSWNNFISTQYPSAISNLQSQLNSIFNPNLTLCPASGIGSSDTYTSILTKLSNSVCDLIGYNDISSANWDQCFAVSPTPTTTIEGFNVLIDQICTIAGTTPTVVLPTFNNENTCLPGPLTTSDSLISTIDKIKIRLCQTGVFDIDEVPWDCMVNPAAGSGPNIQAAIDTIAVTVGGLVRNDITFDDGQFLVSSDDCNGRTVSLLPGIISGDRFVAATTGDTVPGTLADKLQAGTNVTFDVSDPEKLVINTTFTPGVTYDPNLVDWSACSPCIIENPSPTTLEESFQFLKDEICCITELISNPEGGLKVYYVDGNNPNPGDGSILNPFKTLDSAYNKVVGTGTPKAPENTGIAIEVAASNYTTSLNLFASSTSWNFSTGTIVNYTGTDYLFDTIDTDEYNYFNVSGKWNFNTVNGGLLKHQTPTLESRVSLEINNTEQTMDTEDPLTHPLIRVQSIYGVNAWRRSRLELSVHGKVRSTDNHVLFVDGYTEVYTRGLTSFASLDAGDGYPSSIVPDQRVLYYNNQDPLNNDYMYTQEIRFDSIEIGSDGESAVFIQGLYGNIDFYNVSFDSLQAVNNFQSSSVEIGNLTRASYSGKTRGLTFRNCKFAANIYSGTNPIYPIVSVGNPGVNGISIINSLIPSPYLIDPDLVINEDLGVMANTITNFNIRDVPEFGDSTAAQTAGLVSGDVFKNSIDVPDTATEASGATPTKAEFDALLEELREIKAAISSNSLMII